MFCPECRGEYREGITRCPDCEVALVAEPPPEAHPEPDLVTVLETADPDLLPVVESILAGAEIPFQVEGKEILGLFPVGGFGTGLSRSRGVSAAIKVDRSRAEEATALLASLEPDEPPEPPEPAAD